MFDKILVAIDHSTSSAAVFEKALNLAENNGSALMVQSVLAPFDDVYPMDPYVGLPTTDLYAYRDTRHKRENAGLEKLKALEQKASEAGVSIEFTQSVGDPGKLICSLSETWSADLVIVGRRGLSSVSEFFMGSVSHYVLHHVSCDVLVIQSK
jgi:nucleotide-binding universal stress UspA family protein